jgi:isopentenyl phosphate kinase
MENLIFLKLGGSLITDKTKPYTLEYKVLERLCQEIKLARKKKKINLLLGHGGGSFPHISANKYRTNQGFIKNNSKYGFCQVQNDAATLNRIVINNFLKIKERAFSVSPSSCSLAKNSKIDDFYLEPIKKLLEFNIIPVIYGDTVIDKKTGCTIISTEKLFVYLAKKLKPKRIIIADKAGGVYTADPFKEKNAKFIPEINKSNWKKIKSYLSGSSGIDVTGGMVDKVNKSIELARLGIKVNIVNGRNLNELKKSLLGKETGTKIIW